MEAEKSKDIVPTWAHMGKAGKGPLLNCRWLTSCCVLSRWRGLESSVGSLMIALISFMAAPSPDLNITQESRLLVPSHELRISMYKWESGGHIQSIAMA